MRSSPKILVSLLVLAGVTSAFAQEGSTAPAKTTEELHYSWKLRGALSWVAGLRFPTSGRGMLRTVEPTANLLDTELRISGRSDEDGYYVYQSQIEEDNARTVMTYHGYAWRDKRRSERTLFDYVKRLARIRKENTERVVTRVKPIPNDSIRDVLTGIYFLRHNAANITEPIISEIYSEGKLYPVMFRPIGTETIRFDGTDIATRRFEITAAPGTEKKWPGGVRVWISEDGNHTPIRIEIKRDFAALQLDLQSMRVREP